MDYVRPDNLRDALTWLAENECVVAAGCTDLFPATSKQVLPGPVLDITAVQTLKGVTATDDGWRIGAVTSWSELIAADLPPAFDGLKAAGREVGSVQIQNTGTIAGNLCNASPAADGVPCLMTLDASVELTSVSGARLIRLNEFVTGPRQTALAPGEIMTAILVPASAAQGRSNFLKLGARRYLVISIAMVAVRLVENAGVVEEIAISVGACSAVAARLSTLEATLTGKTLGPGLLDLVTDEIVAAELSPIDDIRADRTYRLKAAAELVRRALAELAGIDGEGGQ